MKNVEGEGMPIYEEVNHQPKKYLRQLLKGDLYIKFIISFPKSLTED